MSVITLGEGECPVLLNVVMLVSLEFNAVSAAKAILQGSIT